MYMDINCFPQQRQSVIFLVAVSSGVTRRSPSRLAMNLRRRINDRKGEYCWDLPPYEQSQNEFGIFFPYIFLISTML